MKTNCSKSLCLAVPALMLSACQPAGIRSQSTSKHTAAANWKVGLYTDSSFATFQSEQSALQGAGANGQLQLYLNYGDFANFEGSPTPGQGIVDVDDLNQNNIQLVLAFEPTNASFCTRPSKTTSNATGGCRLSDLTATSAYAVQAANAYANISKLADALNQPLILRFASEMNANWDDWDYGYDSSGNSPANFIAAFAFAHHYITKNLHTGKVLFAFAPNNNSYDGSTFGTDIQAFWPGSANVDIIGLDGYSVSNSFDTDFDGQLQALEGLGSQPLMLAEFAASTNVGGRAAWLDAMVQDLQSHPRVQYMNWFDSDKSHPYQLADTDSTGQSLYAEFAQDLLGASTSNASGATASAPQDAGSAAVQDAGNASSVVDAGGGTTPDAGCLADGQYSIVGDGSDCCTGAADVGSDGICGDGTQVDAGTPPVVDAGVSASADAGSSAPQCVPDGSASVVGDGSDCCSGTATFGSDGICGDGSTADAGAGPSCVADGQPSQSQGADCCSGNYDPSTNDCGTAACVPNGQPDTAGDGSSCCSDFADENDNCASCVADGQASQAGDGSDCCSGNFDSDTGNCGS